MTKMSDILLGILLVLCEFDMANQNIRYVQFFFQFN